MTPYFSIIVPVYNVEAYIAKCIESVLRQTFSDFELLLVDDCGTDSSMQIVDAYAAKDNRIRVLHHAHGGLPSTRNVGLRAANGTYIVLVDGDDFLDRHHLEQVFAKLDGRVYDMCISNNYIRYWEDREETVELFPFSEEINQYNLDKQVELISNPKYNMPASACLTVYSHAFLKEHALCYSEELACSEDTDFFLKSLAVAKSILFTEHRFYYYRQDNGGAMTKNMTDEMYLARMRMYGKWIEFYQGSSVGRYLMLQYKANVEQIVHDYPDFKGHEALAAQLESTRQWWGHFPTASFRLNVRCVRMRIYLGKVKGFLKKGDKA